MRERASLIEGTGWAGGAPQLPRRRLGRQVRGVLRNPTLLLGLAGLAVVLAAALVPVWLAPVDPDERGSVLQEIDGQWAAPPFPPGERYPLGSDVHARDLLSRLIHGARHSLTLAFVVAAVRIVIGVTLGWAAAWYPGSIRRYILMAGSISATVPSLLFAYIIIVTIGAHRGIPVFIIGLGLTGWAPWMQLTYDAIQRIRGEQYMEAARAVGSTTKSQVRYYLLPNLLPYFIPAVAQELAAALLILAELGFLGIFVGVNHAITMGDLLAGEQPDLPFPEWAGMLAGTRLEIFRWWWLPIMPALAFAFAIFSLNLLADGLRVALAIRVRR